MSVENAENVVALVVGVLLLAYLLVALVLAERF